jgi:uncharacterized protein (UPF0335 family)
MFAGRQE